MCAVKGQVNRRGAARREALIEAAVELWAVKGWRGTGVSAVAERAGVTDAGLLHHFGTKENFLIQVIAELDRRELAHFQEAFSAGGLDVLRLLPDMARRGNERPGLWKLHLMLQAENLDPDSPAYEYYVQRQHRLHHQFAKAIRTGQERGEIRSDADPDLVAVEIVSFLLGGRFHIEHGLDEIDIVDACEEFVGRLIRDLSRSSPV